MGAEGRLRACIPHFRCPWNSKDRVWPKERLAHRGLTFLSVPSDLGATPCSGAGMMGSPNGSPAVTQGTPGSREVSGIQGWQRIQHSRDPG